MARVFTMSQKCLLTLVLKLHESYIIPTSVRNTKTNSNNKVRTIEQIVLNPVN